MECVKCKKETNILQDDDLIYKWIRTNIVFRTKGSSTVMNYCNNCELAVLSNYYYKIILQLFNTNNIEKFYNDDFCIFTIAYDRDLYGENFTIRYFDTSKKFNNEWSYDIDYVEDLSEDEIYRLAMKYVNNSIFI